MKMKKPNMFLIHSSIIIIMIFTAMIIPLFFYIIGLFAYYLTKKSIKRRYKKHKKFNIEYFRDDLKKLSPSYISYMYDFSIELDKDVAAHVLKLYIDKYIKYEGNKFVITNKNQDSLRESDKCLIEFIKNNFYDVTFLNRYEALVKKELREDGYITEYISKKDILSFFSGFVTSLIGIMSIGVLQHYGDPDNTFITVIKIILAIIFGCGLFGYPAVIVAKIVAFVKYGVGKRTKKGEELLEQIYGLKNFLKDFSIMKERRLEDVYLQEHYLVYAITLEVNTKVDDEILKKIKKHMKSK